MAGSSLASFRAGASFIGSIPSFLRKPVTVEEARATVHHRLIHRDDAFLYMLRKAIYENPKSPYLQLLNYAGCEYGDIEQLVRSEGLEPTLERLFEAGVYLTVDELKVHHRAIRGGTHIEVSPELVRNPLCRTHLFRASGGSRAATVVGVDLRDLRDVATNFLLFIAARGGLNWQHGLWTVPGATVYRILEFAGMGLTDHMCFSQLNTSGLGSHYQWSEKLMRWAALLAGCSLPRPQLASLNDPTPILQWMSRVLRSGQIPHLWTSVSCAVRLCLEAQGSDVDLTGAQLTVSGEPLTPSRLRVIDNAGVSTVAAYGSAETAWIGNGCLEPEMPGEQHVFDDRIAAIQPGHDTTRNMPANALLVTAIRRSAPLVCLNLSMGDQAMLTSRRCGCEMEAIGWIRHAHSIQSYEKLTTTGMSFLDHDLIEILEVTLPEQFGGSPTDYQLVEEESRDNPSQLVLLVSPKVGSIDEARVKGVFLDCLGSGSGRERITAELIRDSNSLRIERKAPEMTSGGKILHLRSG